MIQMTLIQIDNYGPWTVTPSPRAEADLQILQSELYADLQRQFAAKGVLVFFTRFDNMLAFFAIAIVKHSFGGLGNNIWNPALAARAFLQVAYPAVMNSDWRILQHGMGNLVHSITRIDPAGKLVDDLTRATPLTKEVGAETYTLSQLFMGNIPGCIGETSVIALLLGGAYLIYKRYIKWYVPIYYIATMFVMVLILPPQVVTPWSNNPLYHIFSGGLFLGAFFMATDMVTSPLTKRGLIIFAIGAGVFTAHDPVLFWLSRRGMLFHFAYEYSNAAH